MRWPWVMKTSTTTRLCVWIWRFKRPWNAQKNWPAARPCAGGRTGPSGITVETVRFRIERNGSVLRNGRVLRNGSVLVYYKVNEDTQWTELAESPIERTDMDENQLQAGIYSTSESTATATVDSFLVTDDRILDSGFE